MLTQQLLGDFRQCEVPSPRLTSGLREPDSCQPRRVCPSPNVGFCVPVPAIRGIFSEARGSIKSGKSQDAVVRRWDREGPVQSTGEAGDWTPVSQRAILLDELSCRPPPPPPPPINSHSLSIQSRRTSHFFFFFFFIFYFLLSDTAQ